MKSKIITLSLFGLIAGQAFGSDAWFTQWLNTPVAHAQELAPVAQPTMFESVKAFVQPGVDAVKGGCSQVVDMVVKGGTQLTSATTAYAASAKATAASYVPAVTKHLPSQEAISNSAKAVGNWFAEYPEAAVIGAGIGVMGAVALSKRENRYALYDEMMCRWDDIRNNWGKIATGLGILAAAGASYWAYNNVSVQALNNANAWVVSLNK